MVIDRGRGYPGRVSGTSMRRALATVLLAPALAFGHARLTSPPPRTTTILKTPPCGGIARTDTPFVLTAGQPLDVDWVETIDHPGHFELAISFGNDEDFVSLRDDIPDQSFAPGATERSYSTTIQVPSTPCEACTLRLIQFMSDHTPGSQHYYSCADIRIVGAGTITTTTTTAPPTTTTIPPSGCEALPSYDRATCLVGAVGSSATCTGDAMLARLQRGLETVQHLIDDAAADPTSRHSPRKAVRRVTKLRRAVVTRRLDDTCERTIAARLGELRTTLQTLVP
jgi:hypothetical protein